MQSQPILVTGATGKTGSRIISRLKGRGHEVRPGSRSSATPFDWDRPDTWSGPLEGAGAVYICFQPDFAFPGALETLSSFAEAVAAAGVKRVVMLTGRGEPHALQGEAILQRICPSATILRSSWFAQNFSEGSLRDAVMSGFVPMPGGDIREPIIDLDDLADVAAAALTEDRHAGQIYELTGPRLMSFNEIAQALSEATGRTIQHLPITFEEFHAELESAAGQQFADIVTAIARETFDGRNAHVTGGVERAIGRPPRDFADFAKREAAAGAWRTPDAPASPNLSNERKPIMTTTWYQKLILGIAGLTALMIGAAISLAPNAFYASYGIALEANPNLLSELRAPGANLAALGLLMLAGIVRSEWFAAARMIAIAVFFAFATGRLISWSLDGTPDISVQIALAVELVIGTLAALAYSRDHQGRRNCRQAPNTA
ncbi:DUF4345 family protein [Maricaulis sp.]|uniref:DUF4345 family protein n=1 Tax=Maricaulis sp. TaxID=1486257 RepID=UPI0026260609|nr:DUF4345 family protein [Maricaulis sp.]